MSEIISTVVTQLFSSSFSENELFRQLTSWHLGLRTQNGNRFFPQNLFFEASKSTIMCVLVRYQSRRVSSQTLLLVKIKLSIRELRNKLDSFDGRGSGSQYFYLFTDP